MRPASCAASRPAADRVSDIVISEFMDGAAVERLAARVATLYDPAPADDPSLLATAADAAAVGRA